MRSSSISVCASLLIEGRGEAVKLGKGAVGTEEKVAAREEVGIQDISKVVMGSVFVIVVVGEGG